MDREAFRKHYKSLDRSLFLDENQKNMSNHDGALPIGHGQTISQPSLVAAAPPKIPSALLEQLAPNGRMVIPVGPSIWQDLLLITKDEAGKIKQQVINKVAFVELVDE